MAAPEQPTEQPHSLDELPPDLCDFVEQLCASLDARLGLPHGLWTFELEIGNGRVRRYHLHRYGPRHELTRLYATQAAERHT